ncbi:MAG: hemerythrin domain-containing protein [Pseudomonadota bacterium]
MDIYERLIEDHDRQRRFCDILEKTEGDSDGRSEIWSKLKVELEAHASAEEQTFYAELIQQPEATEMGRHSIHEHQEMTKLISNLDDKEFANTGWLPTFKKLAHKVRHHLDEEEKEIFVVARKVIDDSTAKELATAFNERKPAEKQEEKKAA